MIELSSQLYIRPGITAFIGSGGKTSLMKQIAMELGKHAKVILTTTTHIFPYQGIPLAVTEETLQRMLCSENIVCVGKPLVDGKLGKCEFSLIDKADYVLVEADGAKHFPLKAHLPYEPDIPIHANQVIQVVGSHGFNETIENACHRPEQYAELLQARLTDTVTPQMAARVINMENLCQMVFLNEMKSMTNAEKTEFLDEILYPTVIGKIQS